MLVISVSCLVPRGGGHRVSKINSLQKSGKANRSKVFRSVPRVSFPPSDVVHARDCSRLLWEILQRAPAACGPFLLAHLRLRTPLLHALFNLPRGFGIVLL